MGAFHGFGMSRYRRENNSAHLAKLEHSLREQIYVNYPKDPARYSIGSPAAAQSLKPPL
jgi:hypothetical protein